MSHSTVRYRHWVVAAVASAIIAMSVLKLRQSTNGLTIEHFNAGPIPVSVFRTDSAPDGPLVVVAHGFAGSRPMMQQFAVSLAQNGYTSATFDFSGHGRNRVPLTGDLQSIDGATQVLVKDIGRVVDALQKKYPELPDTLAVLGHSMASDLVVRYAQTNDNVMATVGVAMFSPAVTATSPHNLLMINGEWEPRLNNAAMDVLQQASADDEVNAGITYGRFDNGTARRFEVANNSEHIAVLFSVDSASATINWLDQVFGIDQTVEYQPQPRGRWILLLIAGIVTLWWVFAPLLPTVSHKENTSRLTVTSTVLIIVLPMVLTPLILSFFTIGFLPVLVGDYLAVHLALYGLLSAALTVRLRRGTRPARSMDDIVRPNSIDWRIFSLAVLLLLLFSLPLAVVLNWQVASFWPTVERLPLLLAVGAGTLCWFLADEWATRGSSQWRWAYPVSKVAFLISLGIAVALDFDGLFFLLLIVPLMIPMLVVFGLLSRWSYRSTGCAQVAAVSNALVLAWAIAVTFPWVAASTLH